MQYKKDEVRKKLIEAGEEDFFIYGFMGSSIRRIVKSAGTTIGNFYNYYANKEELFSEIVGSELKRFDEFINSHDDMDDTDKLTMVQDISSFYKLIEDNTSKFMPVFTKRFYILVACSRGTAYEGSGHKVKEYIKMHLLGHVLESSANIDEVEATADVFAYEFMEGLLFIIRKYGDTDTAGTLIKNHLIFFLIGTMGMLKGPKGSGTND